MERTARVIPHHHVLDFWPAKFPSANNFGFNYAMSCQSASLLKSVMGTVTKYLLYFWQKRSCIKSLHRKILPDTGKYRKRLGTTPVKTKKWMWKPAQSILDVNILRNAKDMIDFPVHVLSRWEKHVNKRGWREGRNRLAVAAMLVRLAMDYWLLRYIVYIFCKPVDLALNRE